MTDGGPEYGSIDVPVGNDFGGTVEEGFERLGKELAVDGHAEHVAAPQ